MREKESINVHRYAVRGKKVKLLEREREKRERERDRER